MSEPAISLTNVIKVFKLGASIKIPIFNDLNFTCGTNDFVILSGPSGSGKTTLLSIIGGLATVDGGDVLVLNHHLSDMSEEDLALFRATYIGFVFQTGHLIDSLTVLENIMLPVHLAGANQEEFQDKALELIEEFQLAGREHSLPILISGGEYQRVVFIRGLLMDPELLLVDEPTSNQDSATSEIIHSKLSHLKGTRTIVCVTHNRDLFKLADSIYIPEEGRLNQLSM
ncbi:MAG: ABC transporter ATP-binding protein [Candidatus Heimdallarchaeota archaeon]